MNSDPTEPTYPKSWEEKIISYIGKKLDEVVNKTNSGVSQIFFIHADFPESVEASLVRI